VLQLFKQRVGLPRAAISALLAGPLMLASTAAAQLFSAKQGAIVYGHHHLYVTSIPDDKKFFIDALGGKSVKVGTSTAEVVEFPNVFIFFTPQPPTGGTKGTTVEHISFAVQNLQRVVDKIRTSGFKMITRSEVAPGRKVKNDIAVVDGNLSVAYALAPDDLIVEFVEQKRQPLPIMLHGLCFQTPQNAEMQAWYVKIFGAQPHSKGVLPSATLPGVVFYFAHSDSPVAPTRGRAIDHIGFEVQNLAEFCKNLEAQGIKLDSPYRPAPAFNTYTAHFTDPWGTNIELVEGMASLP
jgi:catechol 2,3-dioxygenase-like lactoylglutathione lyase family enzyme/predicted enzyme related to lactoylglutathione lyase